MAGHTLESAGQPAAGICGLRLRATSVTVRTFLGNLESRAELDWFSNHVLELILRAFAAEDHEFPNPGCKTIVAGNVPRLVEGGDEFAITANALIRGGASDIDQVEILARLGLLEISKRAAIDAVKIADCAQALLWMESNSQLPIMSYATSSFASSELAALAQGISGLLNESALSPSPSYPSRGAKFVAVAWLGSLDAATRKQLNLRDFSGIIPPIPISLNRDDTALWPGSATNSSPILVGRLAAVPSGPVATALCAVTGWLLARHIFTGMLRVFLAYHARAEVRVTREGLEVREQKSLLGRKLREKISLITLESVQRLTREVRYARTGTYVGLAALAVGSFVGMRLFVDGLRVPGLSLPLLWLGLVAVFGGLLLDFLLANWLDAKEGQCRFVVVTERGRGLCLAGVDPGEVDAILAALAKTLVS
jgi:hypothetical protein